jgi:hypothetical protein
MLTTDRVEELLQQHNFIDRGGSKKESTDIRYRLYSIGTQSNLILEIGSEQGIRVLLSANMQPLVDRLKSEGTITVDDVNDFSLREEPKIKFEIEKGVITPYWWRYKVGSYDEDNLLRGIELYNMLLQWGEKEITGVSE